jgi:hypothetical protein
MHAWILDQHGADATVTIVAKVVFHGLRAGTQVGKIGRIDARDFSFPILLCHGCLQDCSTCNEEDAGPLGEDGCPTEAQPGDFVGGLCGNAQDFFYAPGACEAPD